MASTSDLIPSRDTPTKPIGSDNLKVAVPAVFTRSRSPLGQTTRPNLHPQRPSWVGPLLPPRPTNPAISTMTQKVKILYSSPGLKAPVYVAGSLGDQPWEPVEMQYTQKEDGELDFWQEFDVEEGEYQYKFRLGPGDWWVLDESRDIVDDGAGNRNNKLVVKREEPNLSQAQPEKSSHVIEEHSAHDEDKKKAAIDTHVLGDATAPIQEPEHSTGHDLPASDHNLFKHETPTPNSHQMLFKHESLHSDSGVHISSPVEFGVEDEEDEEDVAVSSPLFRHESLAAIHTEHDGPSPLFRHESMSPIDVRHSTRSVRSSSTSSFKSRPFEDDDIADPSLERFPTERDGIMAHLDRASSRLPEDETDVEGNPPSPCLSQKSFTASPSFSAPKENNEHLGCIDEDDAEALSPERATPQESSDKPVVPVTNIDKLLGQKKETSPKLSISPVHEPVNQGPLTPPMTPIDELQGNGGAHDGSVDNSTSQLKKTETPRTRKDNSTDHIASRSSSISSKKDKEGDSSAPSFWTWMSRLCGGRIGSVGIAVAVSVAAAFYAIAGRNSSAKMREVLPSP